MKAMAFDLANFLSTGLRAAATAIAAQTRNFSGPYTCTKSSKDHRGTTAVLKHFHASPICVLIVFQVDMLRPGCLGTYHEFGKRYCLSPWADNSPSSPFGPVSVCIPCTSDPLYFRGAGRLKLTLWTCECVRPLYFRSLVLQRCWVTQARPMDL